MADTNDNSHRPESRPSEEAREPYPRWGVLLAVAGVTAVVTALVAGLLINIAQRRWEAQHRFIQRVEVTEHTIDPTVWGQNWPHQYNTYRRTVDYERTRYGGSDAVPAQKLDEHPWLRTMWAGYAFALDYRESRGHAYMLHDQDHTERVAQRPQPGACLHCHSSILPAYRYAGGGLGIDNVMQGFRRVNQMSWNEARHMTDEQGNKLITHPLTCIDCHEPATMALRITRPAFIIGMQALARGNDPVPHLPSVGRWRASDRRSEYDPNSLASQREMRSMVCAQCHVEYYFTPEKAPQGPRQLVYPWHRGLKVEDAETYYDEIGFSDWTHAATGAGVLKAQHPEFELWSQGTHAQAGVSCADCHMPYERVGALKVSNHHVRSPLLNVAASCQVCHNVPEQELLRRAHTIQDRTYALINRSAEALTAMIDAIVAARATRPGAKELEEALQLQRKAQWRIDYVYSEGSMGFHAAQESARILAEALDYARRGEGVALRLLDPESPLPAVAPKQLPLEGITPENAAPPGPRTEEQRRAPGKSSERSS